MKQRAIRLLDGGGPQLHGFVLDHDYAWADGLICGGKMVILAEVPDRARAVSYFRSLSELLRRGSGMTEAIVVEAEAAGCPVGTRACFDEDGTRAGHYGDSADGSMISPAPLADRPRPSVRQGVAYLPTLARVRLVIVGAGHVGQAVAELAARADFDVTIVDDRRQYANAERFPSAETIVVGPLDEVIPSLPMTVNTFALIVTRGHGHDQEALSLLAPTIAPYVGLIGSRRKIRMILDALREQGVSDEALARVSAPVGLDIGSETVPEIAVSIVAELIARRNLGSKFVGATGQVAR